MAQYAAQGQTASTHNMVHPSDLKSIGNDLDLDEGTDFVPESISSDEELIDFLVVSDDTFTPTLSPSHSSRVIQTAAAAGVTTYGYIFTDQHAAAADPPAGVQHASEIPYVYGAPAVTESDLGVGVLATSMTHYWISFAVSGTANDGKGLRRGWC
ncbi:hypothetical protein BD309DRAFT_990637 [Dichomitus squalens]|uniref:Carboxylesterase type B domain-containing protein n=1 Tax=Dichomitus squalens TaxID=114155 RepID=A0A4Q9NRQ5_9APHY|nr:hypothetical protein BD309DRAFT_990637 [Dichomitus squalens]TBU53711.1 hypothetical protein BD310DRAFT_951884 [Dichomitus squalens]